MSQKQPPKDDVSSAPESGTVRDETSGTGPAPADRRGANVEDTPNGAAKDDPANANEAK